MLRRNLDGSGYADGLSWEDLKAGVPTIVALAKISARAFAAEEPSRITLSDEANTILFAARNRGTIEIRNDRNAFDSIQRFLAVAVETEEDLYLVFKSSGNPEQTVLFMEGFRQLCRSGLVMHQSHAEFSLTAAGYDLAKTLTADQFEQLLNFAEEMGR